MLRIISIFVICVATGFAPAVVPPSHTLDTSSTIKVHGTSTLRDWTMVMEKVSGEANIKITDDEIDITRIYIRLKGEDLKSGYELMDQNTYASLNTEQFPTITYDLSTVHEITQSGHIYEVDASGILAVAGKMQIIRMTVELLVDAQGNVAVSGRKQLKITDFGIEPPEVMFGTVTTGNEIEVEFAARFSVSGES